MPKYKLNIKITENDLQILYRANEKIVIVKHTAENTDTQVAWVTFGPFMNNTVEWESQFALYASNTEIQSGAFINKLSDIAASTQTLYQFKEGIFQNPISVSTISSNTFALKHVMTGYPVLTFGLAQNVVVNGEGFANHPINAINVPFGQAATMTPVEILDVYLKNDINSSTVVSHIMSEKLTVSYTEELERTIAYDGATGAFYLVS